MHDFAGEQLTPIHLIQPALRPGSPCVAQRNAATGAPIQMEIPANKQLELRAADPGGPYRSQLDSAARSGGCQVLGWVNTAGGG